MRTHLVKHTIPFTSFVFVLLFSYTGINKLIEIKAFRSAMLVSPYLKSMAEWLTWVIIAVEILIVILLSIPQARFWGLFSTFLLMMIFTVYIGWMLSTQSRLPCSCGGILKELSWQFHLILNITLTFLVAFAVIVGFKMREQIFNN